MSRKISIVVLGWLVQVGSPTANFEGKASFVRKKGGKKFVSTAPVPNKETLADRMEDVIF